MWYDLTGLNEANKTNDANDETDAVAMGQVIETIAINERVIAYGDGFFTTMAVVNGEVNWLSYHHQRIDASCQALQLCLDITKLLPVLQCHATQLGHGILKLIVCRQNQPQRGYGFANEMAHIWLSVSPAERPLANHAQTLATQPAIDAICLNQSIACLPPPLAGIKLLNAQDKVLASGELRRVQQQRSRVGEGLVQDVNGHWVEGTFCNVFYRLANGPWFTPPITESGVGGVMRQVLLDHAQQRQRPIEQRVLTTDELEKITSLVFCNAVRGLLPVRRLYLSLERCRQLSIDTDFD